MKIGIVVVLLSVLCSNLLFGQNGSNGTYQFLDLPNSAKVAALGGTQLALTDNDVGLSFYNPSLLKDSMRNQLSVNYVSYIAGIGVGYAAFSPNSKGPNTFAVAVHYVNYGTFEGASETGQLTGSFNAAEYAINLLYSRDILPRFRGGINLKPIFSSLENYHSFGIAADLGLTYNSSNYRSAIALVARNIGRQITTYYQNGNSEKLPWDIQLGFSQRLTNAPVRFLITANHLNEWDLGYSDQSADLISAARSKENFTSLVMRHLIFGGEISPDPHIVLRFGYTYQRRKELALDSRMGMVGYSAGLGIKLGKFNVNYGIASYHLAAAVHYFSLTTTLSEFIP